MSGQLGELVISLAADTARFRADLGKATKATQDASRDMSAHFDKMGAAVKTTIGLMAGLAGVASLGALVKSSIDAADNMSKMSQKVGVAIDQLSGMAYAASLADVSTEQLGKGMGKLAKLMYEAAGDKNGGPAETFKTLGITVTDAAGKLRNTDDVMMDVADRLSGMEDGAAKTALAMEVFGKAGADLIPLLNGGKKGIQEAADEAKRFGLILNEEAGKQAEEFNDNLTRLQSKASGAAVTLASEMLPAINSIVGAIAKGGNIEDSFLMKFMNATKDNVREIQDAAVMYAALTDKAIAWVNTGGAVGHMFSAKKEEYERQIKVINQAEKDALEEIAQSYSVKAKDRSKDKAPGSGTGETGKPKKTTVDEIKYSESNDLLLKNILLYEKMGKTQEEVFYNLGQEIEQAGDTAARVFDLMNSQTGDLKTDRYNVTPLSKYGLNTANYGIPQTTTEDTEGYAERLKLEQDFQRDMFNVKADAASSALGLMQAAAGENKAMQVAAMVGEKALSIARIMMNTEVAASAAIAAYAMLPGGVAAGVAQAASIRAMSYVSIGMVVASGAMEGMNIAGARANGGPVTAGQTYLINENRSTQGPEYFTPGVSGTITPANKMNGGDVTIVQNFSITGVAADLMQNMKIIAGQAKDAAKSEILNSMNRGGDFALASGRIR